MGQSGRLDLEKSSDAIVKSVGWVPRRGGGRVVFRPGGISMRACWEDVLATVVGGVAGAVAGGLLVRSGLKPWQAASVMTVGGGALAVIMEGRGQLVAAGAAAAGAGQLALEWMAKEEVVRNAPAGSWFGSRSDLVDAIERERAGIDEAFAKAVAEMDSAATDEEASVSKADPEVSVEEVPRTVPPPVVDDEVAQVG